MYTQTIKMPVQKDSNIVKIAVEMTDQVAQLIEFNQKHPLTGIIQVLATKVLFIILLKSEDCNLHE